MKPLTFAEIQARPIGEHDEETQRAARHLIETMGALRLRVLTTSEAVVIIAPNSAAAVFGAMAAFCREEPA